MTSRPSVPEYRPSRFFGAAAIAGIFTVFLSIASTAVWGQTQTSAPLVSKSIPLVFGADSEIFAFSDIVNGAQSFSRLNLFQIPTSIQNGTWPWYGGAENGVSRLQSVLLISDISVSDTTHVARAASLSSGGVFLGSDSLTFPLNIAANNPIENGTSFTAVAVWHDTAVLGFGRLGIAYSRLAAETSDTLITDSTVTFSALSPSSSPGSKADSVYSFITCRWNQVCPIDTLTAPSGGLDSVIDLMVDSSAPDSIWLLIATPSGLRRGLMGSQSFPLVSLPSINGSSTVAPVQNFYSQPNQSLLWAFTGAYSFFSGNHGQSFLAPPVVDSLFSPDSITGFASAPQAVSSGDTTFVNFNLDQPGLVSFRQDSIQATQAGTGLDGVLIGANDSLDITEGSLTSLAVARSGSKAVLAVGSTLNGLYYRRLDLPGKTFTDLNRLDSLAGSLNQVITFPTVFSMTQPVHLGYRLAKNGNVTITVFNYAMEKVRVLVENSPRLGGVARSENQVEDQWDGKDAGGRFVSVGVYYILVQSDQGEHGFGKAIYVGGRQ